MHALVILPILIVLVVILKILDSSKVFTGFLGEQGVRSELKQLDETKYHIINDLMIPNSRGNGTSQIDHVVVSNFGVCAIETKNWAGRVFGKGSEPRWTVALGRNKYRKENPIVQNLGHIKALCALLGNDVQCYNIVVFGGRADLHISDLGGASVIRRGKVARTIRAIESAVLNDEQANQIHQRLLAANITDPEARKRHVATIRQRFHG